MAKWRVKALELLPELKKDIEHADTPMYLWANNIHFEFDKAYEEPRNDDLVKRIYAFADWSLGQPRNADAGRDLFTCVIVGFYEHIATNKAARMDMPRWFTNDDIDQNRAVFGYLLDADELEEMLGLFGLKPIKVKPKHPAKPKHVDKPKTKRR